MMTLSTLWRAFRDWWRSDWVVIEHVFVWEHPKTCRVRFVDGQPYAVLNNAWVKLKSGGEFYEGKPAGLLKWHPASPRMARHFNWQDAEFAP